jgi:hypothetical protein
MRGPGNDLAGCEQCMKFYSVKHGRFQNGANVLCRKCKNPLYLVQASESSGEVDEGSLTCPQCGGALDAIVEMILWD